MPPAACPAEFEPATPLEAVPPEPRDPLPPAVLVVDPPVAFGSPPALTVLEPATPHVPPLPPESAARFPLDEQATVTNARARTWRRSGVIAVDAIRGGQGAITGYFLLRRSGFGERRTLVRCARLSVLAPLELCTRNISHSNDCVNRLPAVDKRTRSVVLGLLFALVPLTSGCGGNADSGSGQSVPEYWTQVAVLSDATSLAVTDDHACVLRKSGEIRCWGSGLLGDGKVADRSGPVVVSGIDDAVAVAVHRSRSCALRGNAEVWCWGAGARFVEGIPTAGGLLKPVAPGDRGDAPEPVHMQTLDGAVATAVACTALSGGSVTCSGKEVLGLPDAVKLSAGNTHSCAVRANSEAACWGEGSNGQLGGGDAIYDTGSSAEAVIGLDDATTITAGNTHTCAVRAGGQVACWGWGGVGQLGDGTSMDSTSPVAVSNLDDAVDVALTTYGACTLRRSGQLACWGAAYFLPSDPATGLPATAPLPLPGIDDAIAIAGEAISATGRVCVIRKSGAIWCTTD